MKRESLAACLYAFFRLECVPYEKLRGGVKRRRDKTWPGRTMAKSNAKLTASISSSTFHLPPFSACQDRTSTFSPNPGRNSISGEQRKYPPQARGSTYCTPTAPHCAPCQTQPYTLSSTRETAHRYTSCDFHDQGHLILKLPNQHNECHQAPEVKLATLVAQGLADCYGAGNILSSRKTRSSVCRMPSASWM